MGSFRWSIGDDMPAWSPGLYRILGLDSEKPRIPYGLIALAHEDDKEILKTAIDSVVMALGLLSALPHRAARRRRAPSGDQRRHRDRRERHDDRHVGIVTDITAVGSKPRSSCAAMDASAC
ncbi:MAG: hypothetical protein U1F24_03880 [Alphaproteobacteria bacterium]